MKEQNSKPATTQVGYGETMTGASRSRRGFLKLAGSAVALGAVLPLGVSTVFAKSGDWVISNGFPASGPYLSPVQSVGTSFNGIGSYWEVNSGNGNALVLQIRVSADGGNFGDWTDVPIDPDERGGAAQNNRFYGRMLFATGSYAQFRLNIPAGLSLKLVGLGFVDSSKGPTPPQAAPAAGLPQGKPTRPYIISRADWGANEAYRYSGGAEVWPKEYRPAKVIVIHHSETPNTYNANPAVDVRGIYYYHAITKGWGDIGYNYLIDWKGNIYEGRAGGENIVGGHAYQYNWGSVGICMIGSFASTSPSQAQLDSLARLMAWEAADKNIDPNARIFFIDRNNVATITGHRDIIDTTCPGNAGYAKIPGLRQQVTSIVGSGGGGGGSTTDVTLKSVTFSPTTVKQGDLLQIAAVITNTGNVALDSQDPAPGFVYDEGQSYESQALDKQNGKFRLAIDFTNNTGVSHPYRWGFGKTLQPGETITVTGYVRMKTARQIDMFGGIIQEYVKYFGDNIGTTRIQTNANGGGGSGGGTGGPNPTARVASRASDPNVLYFNETGHNMGYAFRRYWEQHGGLSVFGYPLTDEFKETSSTEPNKTYTVQYFQRNRFEYHPENAGTAYEVLLGLLGVQVSADRTFFKVGAIPNTADKVYFNETGHTLGGAFYRYWKANGGLALFGYPISEEFQERNPDDNKVYTVQYFQRNRMEFHPENHAPYDVLLGLLGTQLCRQKGWM